MLKTGPHVGINPTGLSDWLRIGVSLVKYCDYFPRNEPNGGALLIGRSTQDGPWPILTGDPIQNARNFVQQIIKPVFDLNPHILAWESRNEPVVKTPDEMKWMATHLAEFARVMREEMRLTPVIGAWSVGNPDFSLWQYYTPVLEACRNYLGLLSRHCYGDLNNTFAFRYRTDQDFFSLAGHAAMPLVITECGADTTIQGGGTFTGGWKKHYINDFNRYFNEWIKPFEIEIRRDGYVLGATLFELGGGFAGGEFDVAGTDIVERLRALDHELAHPPLETPIGGFPGNGKSYRLYNQPSTTSAVTIIPSATWWIDIFEVRQNWLRVSRNDRAPLWLQVGN